MSVENKNNIPESAVAASARLIALKDLSDVFGCAVKGSTENFPAYSFTLNSEQEGEAIIQAIRDATGFDNSYASPAPPEDLLPYGMQFTGGELYFYMHHDVVTVVNGETHIFLTPAQEVRKIVQEAVKTVTPVIQSTDEIAPPPQTPKPSSKQSRDENRAPSKQ